MYLSSPTAAAAAANFVLSLPCCVVFFPCYLVTRLAAFVVEAGTEKGHSKGMFKLHVINGWFVSSNGSVCICVWEYSVDENRRIRD